MFLVWKPRTKLVGPISYENSVEKSSFQAFKLLSDRFVFCVVWCFGFLSFQTLWYLANLNL